MATTELDLGRYKLGWHDVALMCGHEMAVPGALQSCVRVLIHWNTARAQSEIKHIYIRGAKNLRPDRASLGGAQPS